MLGRWMAALVLLWAAMSIAPAAAQPLPEDYWRLPLSAQGAAPPHWSLLEQSIAPQDCGQCHADKLAEWSTSLHSRAFSPGLVGQLLTFTADEAQECMNCHAPLAEQAAAFKTAMSKGRGHDPAAQNIAAAGNSCAGCHLRGHTRFGPPQRGQEAAPALAGDLSMAAHSPHGEVVRSADFEKSEFCAACHQFPQDAAINGKPLENTLVEWRESPAAQAGLQCQNCHMPDRKHLWRGIHDPLMVAQGLEAKTQADDAGIRFMVKNVAVGHAFPTYVTPKVMLKGVALDYTGAAIAGSERETVIQRRVDFVDGRWIEAFDTRLPPGAQAILQMPWTTSGKIRVWMEVHPDDFYDQETYDFLLRGYPKNSPQARLIAQADAQAGRNRFRLFQQDLTRP